MTTLMNKSKLLPPAWLLISMISTIALNLLLPFKHLISPPFSYFGIILMVLGVVAIASQGYLIHQNNTTIEPFKESTFLVTEGLYRYSRNPIYLGMMLFLIGLWVLLGSLTPLLVIAVFPWLIQEKFIKIEEQMLEDKFGDQYLDYKQKVRRWI